MLVSDWSNTIIFFSQTTEQIIILLLKEYCIEDPTQIFLIVLRFVNQHQRQRKFKFLIGQAQKQNFL